MKLESMQSVVTGNIEAINQGLQLLGALTDEQYTHIVEPYSSSSIGDHFRHILDMFLAITTPAQSHTVDYDLRRRGAAIESQRVIAFEELLKIRSFMEQLQHKLVVDGSTLLEPIILSTEVTIEETHSVALPSTLLRELVFTSSHAVHHFALMSVIAKLQGVDLAKNLGIAPATATHLRAEAQSEHAVLAS